VAELADAQDLGFRATHLLKLTHRYSAKNKDCLSGGTKSESYFSGLLIRAHGKVIDKLKKRDAIRFKAERRP